METRLGVIAGSGGFPIHVCQEAQGKGFVCVVAGIKGEATDVLEKNLENFEWFDIHEIGNLISFFKKNQISDAVFAGKIDHRVVYKNEELRNVLPSILSGAKDWTPTTLIQAAIQIFAAEGIAIKDPTPYIESAFCEEGSLTKVKPSAEIEEEILFGWGIARKLADLDIGQTVIVKGKAIVAVEGIEGTDETIKRAGELAGKGIVAIKVSRSTQDPRIDLPAVGLETVESLIQAGGQGLSFEARKIPFFQKEEAISLADSHGVCLVAK